MPWDSQPTPSAVAASLPPVATALARGAMAQDLQIDVAIDLSGPGAAGVVFRYGDRDNFCAFLIDWIAGRRVLLRVAGGIASQVAAAGLRGAIHVDEMAAACFGHKTHA